MEKKYRINEIKVDIKEKEDRLLEKVAKKAKIKKEDIVSYEIIRKSIDARKNQIFSTIIQ